MHHFLVGEEEDDEYDGEEEDRLHRSSVASYVRNPSPIINTSPKGG